VLFLHISKFGILILIFSKLEFWLPSSIFGISSSYWRGIEEFLMKALLIVESLSLFKSDLIDF
jgi:hypothetical protein